MGKTSKLNLILILITILSLGIALGVLIKYRTSENNDITREMTVASEAEPTNEPVDESESYNTTMGEVEPLPESEMASLSNPFENSLDSPETGEFVKSLLKQYFAYQISQSQFQKFHKPFGDRLLNIPSNINWNQFRYYDPSPSSVEARKIWDSKTNFPYEVIESVINNFQLANCTKEVVMSKIGYRCSLILPTLEGTGLAEPNFTNHVPTDFKVTIIQEENGYGVTDFR